MGSMMELIRTIRNIKAEFGVASNKKVDAVFQGGDGELALVIRNMGLIRTLAGVENASTITPEIRQTRQSRSRRSLRDGSVPPS